MTAAVGQNFIFSGKCKRPPEDPSNGLFENWLPFVETYRTLCRVPDMEFRYMLQDVKCFQESRAE